MVLNNSTDVVVVRSGHRPIILDYDAFIRADAKKNELFRLGYYKYINIFVCAVGDI